MDERFIPAVPLNEYLTPPIPLTLDRPRTLRLDNRALLRAERELSTLWGRKVSLFRTLSSEDLGLNDLSVLLWQALVHEDPRLTLEQTQALIDLRRLPELIEAVVAAWNAATLPAASRETSPDSPFPNGLTGQASGPSLVSN